MSRVLGTLAEVLLIGPMVSLTMPMLRVPEPSRAARTARFEPGNAS